MPVRRLLWDVKMLFRGNLMYTQTQRATTAQSGAVAIRAERVHPAYEAHARRIDERMVAGGLAPAGYRGVQDRLAYYGQVRGAVFGAYAEWSPDVDALLAAAATHFAHRHWRALGMRTEADLRAIIIARYRRRLGVRVAQCVAQHRIARTMYVGLSRETVEGLRARDRDDARRHAPPAILAPGARPHIADVMAGAGGRDDGHPVRGA